MEFAAEQFAFPGQRPGEKVLMVIRKYGVVYFRTMLAFILTIVAPLFLFLWFWFKGYPWAEYPERSYMVGIFASLFLLYGLLFSCIAWINDAFDLLILSNERLMDITQETLFRRSVTSTPLARIQDATSNVDGFLQTIFNYGHIDIQTASGDNRIFIDRIHKPGETARDIMNAAHHKRVEEGIEAPSAGDANEEEGL